MYTSKDAFRIMRLGLRIGDIRTQVRGVSETARTTAMDNASLLVSLLHGGSPEKEVMDVVARLERQYGISVLVG
jgi:hypothetical protein